ncbi:MAG TPA: glutathione S-transferase N-terminal domain-containing protein, partial [Polymorphobacter sp.]|nr:glutathione S-transferase N-terminal domain-containing protein [Polymorphobacter sp.]
MGAVLTLMGVPGSPYTRKMLAVLRYRHIPYRLLMGGSGGPPAGLPRPKVGLLPTFFLPDADGVVQAVTD